MIDPFGRIFEARAGGIDEPVVGAQAGGYNHVSTGVAVLGLPEPAALPGRAHALWSGCWHGSSRCTACPPHGKVTVRVDPSGAVYSRFPAGARVSLPRDRGSPRRRLDRLPGRRAVRPSCPRIRARGRRSPGHPVRVTLARAAARGRARAAAPARRRSRDRPLAQPRRRAPGALALLDGPLIAGAPDHDPGALLDRARRDLLERHARRKRPPRPAAWSPPARPAAPPRRWLRALSEGSGAYEATVAEAIAVSDPLSLAALPVQLRQPGSPAYISSASAHSFKRAASRWVRPCSGSVCTSSVGAARRAAQRVAGVVERVVDPRQRARAGVARRSPSSFQCALVDRARPRALEAQERQLPRAGRAGAAGTPRPSPPSRWPTPDRTASASSSRCAAAAAREEVRDAVDRVERARGRLLAPSGRPPATPPNSEMTPSISTISRGFCGLRARAPERPRRAFVPRLDARSVSAGICGL